MKNAEKTHSRVHGIFMFFFLQLLAWMPAGIHLLIDTGKPTRQYLGPYPIPALHMTRESFIFLKLFRS